MAATIEKLRELLKSARDIAAKAESEGRNLTTAEREKIEAALAKASAMKNQIATASAIAGLDTQISAIEGAPRGRTLRGPAIFGANLGRPDAANSWGVAVRELGTKALVPSGSIMVPLLDETPHGFGHGPTLLGDVIPVEGLEGTDSFKFIRQTVRTSNAAPVAAGALKPTSIISIEAKEGKAEVIATLSEPIDNTLVSDAEMLRDFIEGELRGMVNTEVNDQVLNGTGASPQLTGILTDPDIGQQAFDTSALVSLRKAKTKVGAIYDGMIPDRALLHPNDAETLDLTEDAQGRFYFGGPVGGDVEQTWRIPVFETNSLPQGYAVVGNFRAATRAYVREEVKIDWSEAVPIDVAGTLHAAFELNQRIYRAEARVGLAILRPAALVAVQLSAGASS